MSLERVGTDPALSRVLAVGLVEGTGAGAAAAGRAALEHEIDAAVAETRERFAGATAGQIPHLGAARELYRAVGIDPTRHRPSPEALTRRVLKGDPFPRVHPFVDLGNVWALRHGLPVGLYDTDRLEGPVTVRLGRPGEAYEGIRKGEVHLDGRVCLADARGPFGNPTSDSLRTSVHEGTTGLLFVLFAPAAHDRDALAGWLDWLAPRLADWFGARTATRVL